MVTSNHFQTDEYPDIQLTLEEVNRMKHQETFGFSDFNELIKILNQAASNSLFLNTIETGIGICVNALDQGGKLMFCGNGGSAADSQHLAAELTIRFIKNRPAISAISLTTDTSALTAAGNDFGFEKVFSRQVEALGRPGDVLIAFSTSGYSKNVQAAVEVALAGGIKVVFLGGGDGGSIGAIATQSILVPSSTTARIQEVHILIGHIICGQIEQRLGLITVQNP